MRISSTLRAIGGALAVTALVLPAAAQGAARRGVNYGGSTSHDDPAVVVLSRDGTKVVRIGEEFEVDCKSGLRFVELGPAAANLRISPSGRFSGVHDLSGTLASGQTARTHMAVTGQVSGLTIRGRWTYHTDVLDATGTVIDTCDQAPTFKAVAAKGAVFAGFTSKGGLAVFELTKSGRLVHHAHVGWRSSCTPAGGFQVGDTLLNFDVVGGIFGDDFTVRLGTPGSDQEIDAYRFHGRIKGAVATGTLRVLTTDTAADGTVTQCDSGALTFRAVSG